MTLHAECPKESQYKSESAWEDYKAARSRAQYSPEVEEELDALFERWSELDNIADAKSYEDDIANAKSESAWSEYETAKEQAEYPADAPEAPPLDPFDRGGDEDAPWETGEGFPFSYYDHELKIQQDTWAYFLMETR